MLGTLLPFNSLVSLQYPDDLFKAARLFIEWLAETGQNVWQMLPISASFCKNSRSGFCPPYSSYGIGISPLSLPPEQRSGPYPEASKKFLDENASWLPDYTLFSVLADKFGTDSWWRWPAKILNRDKETLQRERLEFDSQIRFLQNQQYFLFEKWQEMKSFAKEKGVQIWGDLPFYLPLNSPLVWSQKGAFLLKWEKKQLKFVAGSYDEKHFLKRQIWGFPLYRFDKDTGVVKVLKLWRERVPFYAKIFDNCRLDAAVRFFEYEKLCPEDPKNDSYEKGPGKGFFSEVVRLARDQGMDVYVEDISSLDMTFLRQTCDELGVMGISVFTMILGPEDLEVDPIDYNLSYPSQHIYFTSSHDTLPMVGYLKKITSQQKAVIAKIFTLPIGEEKTMSWAIRQKMQEKCRILIVAMQDWLFTTERINIPGVIDRKNWHYYPRTPIEKLPVKLLR